MKIKKFQKFNEDIFNSTIYDMSPKIRHTDNHNDKNGVLWTLRNYLVRQHNI